MIIFKFFPTRSPSSVFNRLTIEENDDRKNKYNNAKILFEFRFPENPIFIDLNYEKKDIEFEFEFI
jgi:hypothetical protein